MKAMSNQADRDDLPAGSDLLPPPVSNEYFTGELGDIGGPCEGEDGGERAAWTAAHLLKKRGKP